jgi:hypothetical protein
MNSVSQAKLYWSPLGRSLVFALSFSSIACLLAEFYGLCPMRIFTVAIFLPAMLALSAFAVWDWAKEMGELCRAVLIGVTAGLAAAVAYDLFRLPFVFAREWGIAAVIPPLQLFKVFPGFGAMILGEPLGQQNYSLGTALLGWAYHFSNGATVRRHVSRPGRRSHAPSLLWAIAMAVALELGMLASPYASVFSIPVTPRFVVVTLAAHAIFGVCLGLCARSVAKRWKTWEIITRDPKPE